MTIIEKSSPQKRKGIYSYLAFDDIQKSSNTPYFFPKKDNGRFKIIEQSHFCKIPGSPIGYWISENMLKAFNKGTPISELSISNGQNITGDNKRYIRLFWEVNKNKVNKN